LRELCVPAMVVASKMWEVIAHNVCELQALCLVAAQRMCLMSATLALAWHACKHASRCCCQTQGRHKYSFCSESA
jgi:hypothetical protein